MTIVNHRCAATIYHTVIVANAPSSLMKYRCRASISNIAEHRYKQHCQATMTIVNHRCTATIYHTIIVANAPTSLMKYRCRASISNIAEHRYKQHCPATMTIVNHRCAATIYLSYAYRCECTNVSNVTSMHCNERHQCTASMRIIA